MVGRAIEDLRARLRVHVDGPLLTSHDAARKVALVEAGRLVDATLGRIGPLDALAIARGELYALVVSSRHWRWAQGKTSDAAVRDGGEALRRLLQKPSASAEPVPTRAGLETLLIQIAHQIKDEVPRGEGTDEDVDRIARLWRYALTPFLRPYVARERSDEGSLAGGTDELRGPFDSLVHDLVELAFRELGHARITAPPFGGRPAAAWVRELRRRREGAARAIGNRATASVPNGP